MEKIDSSNPRPIINRIQKMIDLAVDFYDIGKTAYDIYKERKAKEKESKEKYVTFSICKNTKDKIIQSNTYSDGTFEIIKK